MNSIYYHKFIKVAITLVFATFFACKSALQPVQENGYTMNLSSSMPQDSSLLTFISPYKEQMNADMQQVIGFSDVEMPRDRDSKAPETLLGNFVVDLVLEYAQQNVASEQVQMCILNIGGLRNSLPKGPITKKNVFELMPFDNELVILDLSGKQVMQMVDYLKEKPQPFSGFTINCNKQLCEIYVANAIFDENKMYRIITSDFLADGGDLMYFLKTDKRENLNVKLRDVILQHIEKTKNISSKINQRIILSHE